MDKAKIRDVLYEFCQIVVFLLVGSFFGFVFGFACGMVAGYNSCLEFVRIVGVLPG